MIDWYIFIPACFALNLAFGPNNLLAMTNGARCGVIFAQQASFGRIIIFIPMIALSALGLGFVLSSSAVIFGLVKIVGAAYLIWLGVNLWRNSRDMKTDNIAMEVPKHNEALKSEALVAVSNPKAILIFAAFFPQFVDPDAYWQSYAMLGAVFLFMESVAVLVYSCIGKFASNVAADKLPLIQRVSGVTMCFFGILLLVSPQPARP